MIDQPAVPVTTVPDPPAGVQRRLAAATAELSRRLGRAPTASDLAAELGMDRQEVVEALVSASAGRGPATGRSPALSAGRSGARAALLPRLAGLPEQERTVVLLRFFGLLTQSQVAGCVGLPPARVETLLASALARLRDQMP